MRAGANPMASGLLASLLLVLAPCLALHASGRPHIIRAARPPPHRICCATRKGFSENNRKQALAKREAARAEAERVAQAARLGLERAEQEKRQRKLDALRELVALRKRREAGRALYKLPDALLLQDLPLCEGLVELFAQDPVQHDFIHWIGSRHAPQSPAAAMMERFVVSAAATGNHDAALQWWRLIEAPNPSCTAVAARSMLVTGAQRDAHTLLRTLTSGAAAAAVESATLECVDRGEVASSLGCLAVARDTGFWSDVGASNALSRALDESVAQQQEMELGIETWRAFTGTPVHSAADVLRSAARVLVATRDLNGAISNFRLLRQSNEPLGLSSDALDAACFAAAQQAAQTGRWRELRWLVRAALLCERTNITSSAALLGLAACSTPDSSGQLQPFGRRRRSLARSLEAAAAPINLSVAQSLPWRTEAEWARLQAVLAPQPESREGLDQAVDLLAACREAGLPSSAASLELALRAMAARPDEPHPAACDLYRQFAELVPEAPAEIASFVLPIFEASSDYVEAMALPGVQPSAAAFAALLQAECNVTAWSLEAAALDEDARARLVSQAFGRTEEQQEELLALKRLFGALPQDVVDFCEGANEVVAAMTASQVACAAECRLTGTESPRSRQTTLAQWLQRQLRTGGELPAATATLLAYCSIAKDAHLRAKSLVRRAGRADFVGSNTTALGAARSQYVLAQGAVPTLCRINVPAGRWEAFPMSPEASLFLLDKFDQQRGGEVIVAMVQQKPELAWVQQYLQLSARNLVPDNPLDAVRIAATWTSRLLFERDTRKKELASQISQLQHRDVRLGLRALCRYDPTAMSSALIELGPVLRPALDRGLREEILVATVANNADTPVLMANAAVSNAVMALYGKGVFGQLVVYSQTLTTVREEDGSCWWDWAEDSDSLVQQSLHPVAWGLKCWWFFRAGWQVKRVPLVIGIAVIEGLALVERRGLAPPWKSDDMSRYPRGTVATRDANGKLAFPLFDCSDSPFAQPLYALGFTLQVLVERFERQKGLASGTPRKPSSSRRSIAKGGRGFAAKGSDAAAAGTEELASYTGAMRDIIEVLDLENGIQNEAQLQTAREASVALFSLIPLFVKRGKVRRRQTVTDKARDRIVDRVFDPRARTETPVKYLSSRTTTAVAAAIALLFADEHHHK